MYLQKMRVLILKNDLVPRLRSLLIFGLLGTNVCLSSARAQALLEAVGNVEGAIHVLPFTRAQIESLIPKELILMGHPEESSDIHPVILLKGVQRNVHFVAGGIVDFPNTLGAEYSELVLLIPNLESKAHPGRHFSYSPTMYLSRVRATVAGYFYKFNKKLAHFSENASKQTIETFVRRKPLFEHSLEESIPYSEVQLKANRSAIAHLFRQPMYQSQGPGALCSYFDWKLDQAEVKPLRASVFLPSRFTGKLNDLHFSQVGLDQSLFGSFHIRGSWSMTLPMKCDQF
jgi:hypothetical protein